MTIPYDRIFKPPSDVTSVLTSPKTPKIQKANVVHAADADGKEKSFDFSKKVKIICNLVLFLRKCYSVLVTQ